MAQVWFTSICQAREKLPVVLAAHDAASFGRANHQISQLLPSMTHSHSFGRKHAKGSPKGHRRDVEGMSLDIEGTVPSHRRYCMKPPPVYARAARRRGRVAKPSGSCTSSGATRRSGPSSPPQRSARPLQGPRRLIQETFYDFELSTAFTKAISDQEATMTANYARPPIAANPGAAGPS